MGDQLSMDMHSMNLGEPAGPSTSAGEEPPLPKISLAREKVLEEARKAASGEGTKPVVSLVVIGENIRVGATSICSLTAPFKATLMLANRR
jgi:hypothetical protein